MSGLQQRLAAAVLLAAPLASPQAAGRKETRHMNAAEWIAGVEQSGRLDDVVIEYWTGGGQPPPYYRSEQLRVVVVEGAPVVEFSRVRFDTNRKPPEVVERHRAPLGAAEVRSLARAIRESGALTRSFPEEKDRGVADLLRSELAIARGSRRFERRYFHPLPAALAPLAALVESLGARARTDGRRQLLHQGKPIEP